MRKAKIIKATISIEIDIPEDWDSKEDDSNPRIDRICEKILQSRDVNHCEYNFYITTK